MSTQNIALTQADDSKKLLGGIADAAKVHVTNAADFSALVPNEYNEVSLSYTGENLTSVVYKQAAVIVATLTLAYTGDKLTSVVRS